MRSYNIEKTEKITRTKAILTTLVVHFVLLYGLFYLNSDQTNKLMPDFVKEWIHTDKSDEAVATTIKRP